MAKIELYKHAKVLEKLAHDQVYDIKVHGGISPIILVEFLLQVAVMVEANEAEIERLKTRLKASYSITENQKTPPTIRLKPRTPTRGEAMTEPTAGAVKAAAAIIEIASNVTLAAADRPVLYPLRKEKWALSPLAAIIDCETGLPELVEALKDIASVDRIMIDGLGYEGVITKITERAQAVLAKYEGKEIP